MNRRRSAQSRPGQLIVLAILAFAPANYSVSQQSEAAQQPNSRASFRELLQEIASFSPDPCGPPYGTVQDSGDVESRIFQAAVNEVSQALNAPTSVPRSPQERAAESLEQLRKLSAEMNASWPDENRLQFQILDISPALVLKLTIRGTARFFVFGVPEEDSGKPNRIWRVVGSDDESDTNAVPWLRLDLYPLHRGHNGNARFLAKFIRSGCAGSVGVSYDAREWSPEDSGALDQIIKQAGAFGLDDKVPGFPEIGELRTKGSLIALPYCWFSAIDTWDNPSMCAVDTYDVSGNVVSFRTRTYNRPDLLPIAKALEFAEQRDYPAVLAYCGTANVARALVRDVPPSIFAEDLKVTRLGNGRERVEFGSESAYRFEVEMRNGRWLVAGFSQN